MVPRHRHSAVDRNRLKRRLRELVRVLILPSNIPVELVIWAQRAAYDATFERLRAELEQVLHRLRRADPGGA